MDTCVPLRGDRTNRPWRGALDEQLLLPMSLPLEPVVDCAGRNRGGQRPEVVWRRAGDGRELAETPVGQPRGVTRCLAQYEVVGGHRFRPLFRRVHVTPFSA